MTFQPSSTSNSRGLRQFRASARRYLGWTVGLVLTASLALGSATYVALAQGVGGFRHDDLLRRHIEAIESPGFAAEIVLVGDSSLGNAIDARLFSELAGRPSVNLALTGSFGHAGSANMLERAARRGSVRTAIIMQTPDLLSREPDPLGEIKTKASDSLSLSDRLMLARLYFSMDTLELVADELLDQIAEGADSAEAEAPPLQSDYIAQNTDAQALVEDTRKQMADPLLAGEIDPEARRGLRRLEEVCAELELRCLYVHGPLLDELCLISRGYLASIDGLLAATRLELVPGTPLCLPKSALGDTVDHVAPEQRQAITRRYFALLQPYL
jgi:hypothetical protein